MSVDVPSSRSSLMSVDVPEPTSTHFSCPHRSLNFNQLGPEGGKAIAAVLMDTQITNLKCAALPTTLTPQASRPANVPAPLPALLLHSPANMRFSCTRSIAENRIGLEGAKTVAAVLKETQITHLKCAIFTHNSPSVKEW